MSTLKVNSIIPTAGVPTGGGGGVVQTTVTNKTDTASQSSVSTSSFWSLESIIKGTITPTSASSKVFIRMMINVGINENTTITGALVRNIGGSETLLVADDANNRTETTTSMNIDSDHEMGAMHLTYLDSPSTTSAVSYYLRITQMTGGSRNLFVNRSSIDSDNSDGSYPRGLSTVILQEVSA